MRFLFAALLFLAVSPFVVEAQRPGRATQPPPPSAETLYNNAVGLEEEEARLTALNGFLQQFPDDPLAGRARELTISTKAALADRRLREGETADALRLFSEAVTEAPTPVSDELFARVLLQIPSNLFIAGLRSESFEIARQVEGKISDDARKLIGLTTFFITVQYATEAIRIAENAIALEPDSILPRLTLATALRLSFRLNDAIEVYRGILSLDPESVTVKLNLADLLRATDRFDESIGLYRDVLKVLEDDATALAGLAIALHKTGGKDATLFTERAALADPSNGLMHASIALQQVISGDATNALDTADRAIAASPASSWGYIAKARAMRALGDYDEAERLLVFARSLGEFPSLNYELAALRLSLGYYREAAETIFRGYGLEDDLIVSFLGNRVLADSESFSDLVKLERRAVLLDAFFQTDSKEETRLKNLMLFVREVSAENPDNSSLVEAAKNFISGDDSMRLYREIFVAGRMLQRNAAVEEAVSILRSAVSRLEEGLDNPMAAPATLADDIYMARQVSFGRGERIFTPRAERSVLSNVLRGRLEELTGLGFLLSDDPKQAIVRFRRALTVLPENSVWWTSAQWRLGTALEADGNLSDAVEAYMKTYDSNSPELEKYLEMERVWNILERDSSKLIERIGPKPRGSDETLAESASTEEVAPEVPETATESKPIVARIGLPEDVPLIPTTPRADAAKVEDSRPAPIKVEMEPVAPPVEEQSKAEAASEPSEEVTEDKNKESEKSSVDKKSEEAPPVNDSRFDSIVISVPKKEVEDSDKPMTPCRLVASPSFVNLTPDGSIVRIGVSSFGGDHRNVEAVSASPEDLEIALDATGEGDRLRRFFNVRSKSGKPGTYKVTFSSPCGLREIDIRVR